jgi:hypothetical protein
MTTARDVIASVVGIEAADRIMNRLRAAPDSVRLELAARLNPWRKIETAPKEPPKEILVYCPTNTILVPAYYYVACWHPNGWITWATNDCHLSQPTGSLSPPRHRRTRHERPSFRTSSCTARR